MSSSYFSSVENPVVTFILRYLQSSNNAEFRSTADHDIDYVPASK